jgi:hypothetical protein
MRNHRNLDTVIAVITRALAAASLGLSLPGLATSADVLKSVGEINVASVSVPYRAALQAAGRLPAPVQVTFIGEERLAVASVDGTAVPHALVPRSSLHLTIDVFALREGHLTSIKQLRFETDTVDSRITSLPSGRLLVSAGHQLLLVNENLEVSATSSVERACGIEKELDPGAPYRVALFAASEDIAAVSFRVGGDKWPLQGPPAPPAEVELWCWFSTRDLRPVTQVHASFVLRATVRKFLAYATGGSTMAVSRENADRVSVPTGACDIRGVERDFPPVFLLRFEPVAVFRCRKGAISIVRGDRVDNIRVTGGDAWYFRTDAWNAPLAAFVAGTLRGAVFGGGFTGANFAALVNYQSGASARFPDLKIDTPSPIYAGSTLQYAISPSGSYAAALSGSTLSLYATPQALLQGPSSVRR